MYRVSLKICAVFHLWFSIFIMKFDIFAEGLNFKAGARTRGLWKAKPSQPLKLAPPRKHDGRSSATSYHRKFLPVGVSVTHVTVPVLLSREH